jgi:hypothetical protein
MNFEAWVSEQVSAGEDATISLRLLEEIFGKFYFERRIEIWADALSERLGVTATIHWPSNVVTFYPRARGQA